MLIKYINLEYYQALIEKLKNEFQIALLMRVSLFQALKEEASRLDTKTMTLQCYDK